MIKILIADDHQMFREGMSSLINSLDNMEIIGQAADGQEAVDFINRNMVDIILMDINMPNMSGIEALVEIKKLNSTIKIVMLTMHNRRDMIKTVLSAGADGYLLKDSTREELVNSLTQVYNGSTYLVDEVKNSLVNEFKTDKKVGAFRLTPREEGVLKLICQEFTTPEIAEKLFISVNTVETHRRNLLSKTGCKNGIGLVKFAMTNIFTDL